MDNAFEIQRIYVKKKEHHKGYGKEMFSFCLKRGSKTWDLTGSGWVIGNEIIRPKTFTKQFGFERFSEHHFITGETVDIRTVAAQAFEGESAS